MKPRHYYKKWKHKKRWKDFSKEELEEFLKDTDEIAKERIIQMENKTTIDDLIETFTKYLNDSLQSTRYAPDDTADLINALANLLEARAYKNDIIEHFTTDVTIHDRDVSNLKKRANSKGLSNMKNRAITLNVDVKGLDAVKLKAEELITLIEKAKSCVDDLAQTGLEIKIYD